MARPALASGFAQSFGAGDWPRSYDAQVRAAYLANPVAQRAVRLVAESVAQAPLAASNPAAQRLIAAESAGQSLIETVAAQLLLHGNAYIELLADAEDRVTVTRDDGASRAIDLGIPAWTYSAEELALDQRAGRRVTIAVIQRGTFGLSRPAEIRLSTSEE
jgi:phage portal protein BeeE